MCRNIHDHDDPRFSCDCHLQPPECGTCGEPLTDDDYDSDGEPKLGPCSACRNEMLTGNLTEDGTACSECGAPFNNANPTPSGLCPACAA